MSHHCMVSQHGITTWRHGQFEVPKTYAFGLIGGKLLRLNCSDTKFVITGIILNNVTCISLGLLKGIEKTKAIWILRWNEDESPQDIVKRALLALIFIAIPNSNYLFAGDNAPLMAVFQAIDYIGSIAVPMTLLTLGAQLYSLPRSRNENISSIIIYILTCRFLLMPIIGIFLVLHTTSYYANDPMLWFILILISFGPPAISCVNLAQLANNYQEEFSALLFYGYIFAAPLAAILVMFLLNHIKELV
ncbi:36588_t:CDS:2 [Gigaspora margarita]|uniref:36588_t:CDS:1 n=1 Tax=Gigaspora margarita TaxID=4874 RepID=A0ABM8W5S1_GIGMA|nr:36588_t:CDS:2 [Gigaspora margarita]